MLYSSLSAQDLIRACARSGDAAAWEEFIRRFHRLIAGVVLRTAWRWGENSRNVLDDLVQEVYLKLCAGHCRLLAELDLRHPAALLGYLKVITTNVVHDHFKSLHAEKRGAGEAAEELDALDLPAGNQAAGGPVALEREVLLREIDACLCALDSGATQERDRTIFWLHYRQGMSARAIAALPSIGLSIKGVESTLLRLTRLVRSELAGRVTEVGNPEDEKGVRAPNSFT